MLVLYEPNKILLNFNICIPFQKIPVLILYIYIMFTSVIYVWTNEIRKRRMCAASRIK